MMGLVVAFWILAVVAVLAGLLVVTLKNVFRASLALILCFIAVAGIFVTLSADFLAAVQILVYVGAIGVVIILAIMLTRDVHKGSPSNKLKFPAFIVAVLFLAAVCYAMTATRWPVAGVPPPPQPTTLALGEKLFGAGGFILPLEVAPVLLLAAILGAIVLVREK
jgi:NADH-quinone oxidoreductase subunit J